MKFCISVLLFIILSIICSSCSDIDSVGSDTAPNERNVLSFSDKYKTSISKDNFNVLGFQQNKLFCYKQSPSYTDGSIVFYTYDLLNGDIFELGTHYGPCIMSNDVSFYNGNMYFYCGDINYEDPKNTYVTFYEINTENNTLSALSKDLVNQTLVYTDEYSNGVISYKGKTLGDEALTYLERWQKGSEETVIVSFLYNNGSKTGKAIEDFCVSNDELYVLVWSLSSDRVYNYYINVYDLDGALLREVYLGDKISKMFGGKSFTDIEVFDNYAMISAFNDIAVVIDISSENLEIVLETEFLKASTYVNSENDLFLYNTAFGTVWKYDKNLCQLVEVSGAYPGLVYIRSSGDDVLVSTNNEILYFPNGTFVVEE